MFSFKLSRDVSGRVFPESGVMEGFHNASHHRGREKTVMDFAKINRYHVSLIPYFLEKLKSIQEGDKTMLDKTMVLFGSGIGNASSHSNRDLPILLAGGGFRHGEHKDYPKTDGKQTPLCNLYVSMLQRFGMELDQFGTSTGTLDRLS